MRAVVQVLAAEIPDVQPCGVWVAGVERGGGDQDAVGGRLGLVVIFAAQPPADLCLADAPVAENDQLHVGGRVRAGCQVAEVRADGVQAVVAVVLRQHFGRHSPDTALE